MSIKGSYKYLYSYENRPLFITNNINMKKKEEYDNKRLSKTTFATTYGWKDRIYRSYMPIKKLDDKRISKIMNYKDYQNTNYDYLFSELLKRKSIHIDTSNIIREYIGINVYYIKFRDYGNIYQKTIGAVFDNLKDAKIAFINIANDVFYCENKYKILTVSNSRLIENDEIIKIVFDEGNFYDSDVEDNIECKVVLSLKRINVLNIIR